MKFRSIKIKKTHKIQDTFQTQHNKKLIQVVFVGMVGHGNDQ